MRLPPGAGLAREASKIAAILCWIVTAALASAGGAAHAHGGKEHGGPDSAPELLAPGYGPLGFTPPEPGSYALPPLAEAADGEVLDSTGEPTTLQQAFGGRVVLLSFIYLSCSDVNGCPLATAVLSRVQSRLGQDPEIAERLRLVSLSFDPARDTPAVMRGHAARFAGGGIDWRFLTADSEAKLQPILDAYGQRIRKEFDAEGNELGTFSHLLRVFLIDPARRIRNVYTVSFLHADTLIADVETLLMEADAEAAANIGDVR